VPHLLSAATPLNADDPNWAIGARRQLEARADHDVWDRLPEIASPTLVLGGRFDVQAPPDNVERLAGRIPNARLEFFDGGHIFLLQVPEAWQSVVRFLAEPDVTTLST
jgi:3-oxoadipate enol-lactonase